MTGPLQLDADVLNACVSCGLCLPHCPTYRVTGREIASPRGRITAMRAVEAYETPIDDAFRAAMEECVSCRGCEAACPSGVQFGQLMETTRAALPPPRSLARRAAEWLGYRVVLPRHWLVLACTWVAWAGQRLRLVPARFGLPRLSARSLRSLDVPIGGNPDAWLFTGCVMDAWLRDTHRATVRVMRAAGADVARPGPGGDCCGALHIHAGRTREARRLAWRVMRSMQGDAPVVVNSAGCGAAMKDYGRLIGTEEAARFSARVRDFSEWLAEQPPVRLRDTDATLVVQDPCHLRHVQRAQGAVRTVLAPGYRLVETADDGLCCGAGGVYALLQPALSTQIRARKVDALRRAAPGAVVVSANPGCIVHLGQAGVDVRHPADLLADALQEDSDG
jgi:glycolate dehydrogenase iron-sulfur subunit